MPATRAYCIADPVNFPVDLDDGTLCRAESPCLGTVGALPSGVANWDLETKLIEAAKLAGPKLPAEMREQFMGLFTAQNIAITAGLLGACAASQLTPVGWLADLLAAVVVAAGVVLAGRLVWDAANELAAFIRIARKATTLGDLDEAADHLARVVVTIGITAFIALIMRAAGRFKTRGGTGEQGGKVPRRGALTEDPLSKRSPRQSAERPPATQKVKPPVVRSNRPFSDVPAIRGRRVAEIRRILREKGFVRTKKSKGINDNGVLQTDSKGGSEIWMRKRPDGDYEAVRVDARGHDVDPKYAGYKPHAHKEVVAAEKLHEYQRGYEKTAKKFDDAGAAVRSGDYEAAHIPVALEQ